MELFRALVTVALICAYGCQISEGEGEGKQTKPSPRANLEIKKAGFKYMKAYYQGIVNGKSGPLVPAPGNLEAAMRNLQETAGLEPTGQIDEPTARAMSWPRCGVHDTIEAEVTEEGERKRRYVMSGQQYRWTVMDLTYKIKNYPNTSISIITHGEVDKAVARAFQYWSDVTPLTFTRVPSASPADIVLLFGKRAHTNVMDDPLFDGPGGTLAHAFTPNSGWGSLNGDVHLDDEETFTHKKYFGRNLLYVITHELGHSLGLDHSNTEGALMWPFIFGYTPNYRLPEDDILGIQAIYGPNPNPPVPVPTTPALPTTPMPAPAYCNMTFDDIAILRGDIFAFKGKKLWRFSVDGHLISPEEGTPIRHFFKRTPSVVQAIVERWYDEKILFVKGKKIFEISGLQLDQVTDRRVNQLGLPKLLDAAMHRASEGITYYFKDKYVYKYDEFDEVMTDDSPMKTHHAFSGIPRPTSVTAAFTGIDGHHNLLVGTQYYKVDPNLSSAGILSDFGQDFLRCP